MTDPSEPNASASAVYPKHWSAYVVMSNGRTCKIRPIRESDKDDLDEFFESLSGESIYMRYFEENRDLAKRDAARLVKADHSTVVALVAIAKGQIVGIGNYDRLDQAEAEIAFAVRDSYQGMGLGALLLEHLAAVARERGVRRFRAEVLAANRKMLGTFESSGYRPNSKVDSTVMVMDFDIKPTHEIREIAARREHRADALSIRHIFQPRSVAVWASDLSDGSIGRLVLGNILAGEFQSPVFAVHDDASDIAGATGYADLESIEAVVDLVVLAGTPDEIEARIPACSAANVETALVVTGGFRAAVDSTRQEQLTDAFREAGIRVVGPSALGVINTDPRHTLNACVVAPSPKRGRIGLYCHTGAFAQALLKMINRRGLGVSTFMAAGGRVDVAANDVLQYWEDDPATSVVLIYLESMNNPRKFLRLARRLAGKKPIVAVISGRQIQSSPAREALRKSTLPHWAIDDMLQQAGVMRVDSANEMLDLASLLTLQPTPKGAGVAVVSDSVALGELVIDVAQSNGLEPVTDAFLVATNGDQDAVESALRLALGNPSVHSLVVCHVPPVFGESDVVAQAVLKVSREATKPIVAVMLAGHSEPLVADTDSNGLPSHGSIPVFARVEDAIKALKAVVDHNNWLQQPRGKHVEFRELERSRVEAIVEAELADASDPNEIRDLGSEQLQQILASYDIDVWPTIPVASEDSAAIAAGRLGYPVVLKVADERLNHRLDMGGVRLSIENEITLRTAYLSMLATLPEDECGRLVVQRMAPPGVAVVVAAQEDQLFGPVVSFRIGGEVTKLLEDRAFLSSPLTDRDATDLVSAPRAAQILTDKRYHQRPEPGRTAVDALPVIPDRRALEELVLRVAQLGDDFPELASLKLNPIIVHAHGVAVLNAKASLARSPARTDLEARRLR